MIKKILLLSGLCLGGVLSASDIESKIMGNVHNLDQMLDVLAPHEGNLSDESKRVSRSVMGPELKKASEHLDDARSFINQNQYMDYCNAIYTYKANLDRLVN